MGFLDRILGREESPAETRPTGAPDARQTGARSEDEIAVERYRYLLRTAPPETIEQVHTEAFGKLTTEQRALVFDELTKNASAGDAPVDESPASLARSATRSELRQPGMLEKSFAGRGAAGAGGGTGAAGLGGGGGGLGFGGMFASSLLGSVAGFVIGSAIAQAFIPDSVGYDQASDGTGDGSEAAAADGSGNDASGADGSGGDGSGTDAGAVDDGTVLAGDDGGSGFDGQTDFGSDFGGDFGDFGI
ncbi:hypothetical protein B7R54_05535 [Subtercola boreus]|uniref:DUF2076 domain-containing protein n=1 Tax=Subtercola boreus TaxID=120213 RepID=A0A3E0VGF4_9MICO|nr:hypothetical protein [Subtercola boreus]RFA08749.1 hypothetical protein B7R54_05535 [Subtercola boreus]TQL54294.1 hypothetical protein FB464_1829 [Subtercola boreus]